MLSSFRRRCIPHGVQRHPIVGKPLHGVASGRRLRSPVLLRPGHALEGSILHGLLRWRNDNLGRASRMPRPLRAFAALVHPVAAPPSIGLHAHGAEKMPARCRDLNGGNCASLQPLVLTATVRRPRQDTTPAALPPRPFRASGSDVRGLASNRHHRQARPDRPPPAGARARRGFNKPACGQPSDSRKTFAGCMREFRVSRSNRE